MSDFDIANNEIHILSTNKILVYNLNGKWVRTIPINLNASGIRLTPDGILAFTLGDEHVIHLLDKTGQEKQKLLKRNLALRICRSVSFIKYGNRYLFPMGHSNEILAYDTSGNGSFKWMTYLSSKQLSNEEESKIIENSQNYQKEIDNQGFFDGLLTDDTHVIVPFIKNGNVTLWIKNIKTAQTEVYELSTLVNDLTFSPAHSFFLDNTENENGFLTYIMPYRLKAYLEEVASKERNLHFEKLSDLTEESTNEENPILIEYKFLEAPARIP